MEDVVPTWQYLEAQGWIPLVEMFLQPNDPSFHLPTSAEVNSGCNKVITFHEESKQYPAILEMTAKIIRMTNLLIWFPILALSAPWLVLDLILGKDKRVIIALLIAAPCSAGLYYGLSNYFDMSIAAVPLINTLVNQ
jgi:hypothetical protein